MHELGKAFRSRLHALYTFAKLYNNQQLTFKCTCANLLTILMDLSVWMTNESRVVNEVTNDVSKDFVLRSRQTDDVFDDQITIPIGNGFLMT